MKALKGTATRVTEYEAVSGEDQIYKTYRTTFRLKNEAVEFDGPVRIDDGDKVAVVGTGERVLEGLVFFNKTKHLEHPKLPLMVAQGVGAILLLVFGISAFVILANSGVPFFAFGTNKFPPMSLLAFRAGGIFAIWFGCSVGWRVAQILRARKHLRDYLMK